MERLVVVVVITPLAFACEVVSIRYFIRDCIKGILSKVHIGRIL